MARVDPKEVFRILDNSDGIGQALTKAQVGDAPGTKNGVMALAFKDSTGNLVLPQLTASGKLPVSTDEVSGTVKSIRGSVDAGSLSATAVASLTLTASKTYSEIEVQVSCRQDSLFQLQQNNNGTITTIKDIVVGSGQFTACLPVGSLQVVAGSTGVQTLTIMGNNFETLSALAGTLGCVEGA